ncbi:MAG: HDOD domain-containing protein [Bacteroidota bacterium]
MTEQHIAETDFKFPPLPATFTEVVRLASLPKERQRIEELVGIIERDPLATSFVLRRVNSAYYGISRNITQVDRAIILLGFNSVCNMVMTLGMKQTFADLRAPEEKKVLDHILRVSVATAAYARDVVNHLGMPMPETAFSGGLLHQIGRLVLLYTVPQAYSVLWYDRGTDQDVISTPAPMQEQAFFGTDYVQVGVRSVQRWELPSKLSTIISFHRRPGAVEDTHLRVLTLAVSAGSSAARLLYEDGQPTLGRQVDQPRLAPPLMALAKMRQRSPQTLKQLVADRALIVRNYADSALLN